MALTQTDIEKLEKAIASGARRVQLSDRMVEYREFDQMLKSLRFVKNQVNPVSAPIRAFQFKTDKGL